MPENGYPGEYLIELAQAYQAAGGLAPDQVPAAERLTHFGRYAVTRMVEGQRTILEHYGVRFDVWSSLQAYPFPGGRMFRVPFTALGAWYYGLCDRLGV